MKIAMPWPSHPVRQRRIKPALSVYEDTSFLVLCKATPCEDDFLDAFDSILLERNTSEINSTPPRVFAHDMLLEICKRYPDEDWYGLGNSDCVLSKEHPRINPEDQVLVFHRTDIVDWKHYGNVLENNQISQETLSLIESMRQNGCNNSRIARKLNRIGVKPPKDSEDWTQVRIENIFVEQGLPYLWGRDLFLFRNDIVNEVLCWLKERDPVAGVAGFDADLAKWCEEKFKTRTIFHGLFHKVHPPEWTTNDIVYRHNTRGTTLKRTEPTVAYQPELLRKNFPYLVEDPMNFITNAKLCEATQFLASILPPNIDAVIGIARSGIIPASILSCHLHIPLLTASPKTGVVNCGHGARFGSDKPLERYLVVDDTIFLGRTFERVMPIIKAQLFEAQIFTAAIFATPMAKNLVDYFCVELADPHFLEWNLFNAYPGESCAYDMDGIICQEIHPDDDDDGKRYAKALQTVLPKYLPRRHWAQLIITARLEKYRDITLEWLSRYGVNVGKLIMGTWQNLAERNQPNEVAQFKAKHYAKSPLSLMVESCPIQAKYIADTTKKRVLCPTAKRVF